MSACAESPAECQPGPEGGCLNGGRCVATVGGLRCACAKGSAWGGARCGVFVGHDHACKHLGCPPTTVCVWRPTRQYTSRPTARRVGLGNNLRGIGIAANPEEEGTPFCACLEGAPCPPTDKYKMMGGLAPRPPSRASPSPPAPSGASGALHGALAALLLLALAALAALFVLRWRRR